MRKSTGERPKSVTIAATLLYIDLGISMALSIVGYLTDEYYNLYGDLQPYIILLGFGYTLFMIYLIYMIGRGRNWARITYLILFIAGLPLTIFGYPQYLKEHPITGTMGLVGDIIVIIALVLIFIGPSATWFRKSRREN